MRKELKNKKVLVIGDTILDVNVYVEAIGLSLETPTLKANFISENKELGGTANIAKFLGLLGCECTFVTSLIDEDLSKKMKRDYNINLISDKQIDKDNTKTRYWISKQDNVYKYLQINDIGFAKSFYDRDPLPQEKYDAILLCDYRCGFITDDIIKQCLKKDGKKFVSSQMSDRGSNMKKYCDFDCAIMNQEEYDNSDVVFKKNVVTLGSRGSKQIEYVENTKTETHFKTVELDIINPIGAGDAFCAAYVCTEDCEFANEFASEYLISTNKIHC